MSNLFFDYPSTARIRIKKQNCYYNDAFSYVFRIKTEKLDFLIPKKAVIFSKTHVYIPNDIYKSELTKYYSSVKIIP